MDSSESPYELPRDVLGIVISFVNDARTLGSISMTCRDGRDLVMALPRAHALKLRGGAALNGHVLPNSMLRCINILAAFPTCELCGSRRGSPFVDPDFGVFAHGKCVSKELINARKLPQATKDKLFAARATSVKKFGSITKTAWSHQHSRRWYRVAGPSSDWAATYYWGDDSSGVVPRDNIVAQIEKLTWSSVLRRRSGWQP